MYRPFLSPWDVSQVPQAGPVGIPTGPNTELWEKISRGGDIGVSLRTFGRLQWRMAARSVASDATDSATLTLPVAPRGDCRGGYAFTRRTRRC